MPNGNRERSNQLNISSSEYPSIGQIPPFLPSQQKTVKIIMCTWHIGVSSYITDLWAHWQEKKTITFYAKAWGEQLPLENCYNSEMW